MFDKILLVVTSTRSALDAGAFVGDMASALGGQIIALNVVDTGVAKRLARAGGGRESEVMVDLEESGWKALYEIEEICKDKGARIVLQQVEGMPQGVIVDAAKRFKVDLLVAPKDEPTSRGRQLVSAEKLVVALMHRLPCPLLIV